MRFSIPRLCPWVVTYRAIFETLAGHKKHLRLRAMEMPLNAAAQSYELFVMLAYSILIYDQVVILSFFASSLFLFELCHPTFFGGFVGFNCGAISLLHE